MTLLTNETPEPEADKPAEIPKAKAIVVRPASPVFEDKVLWAQALAFAEMLTYCRPDKSRTEKKFIAKYLVPLDVKFDKHGNIYKQIGENPTVLWSCHTDTVHDAAGFQKIVYWPEKTTGETYFECDPKQKLKSSCMGADDTCGVWLMTEMIKAGVPGLYIFHRGEEVGGKGSKWIAEKNKEALKNIKFAIAFDRKEEKSIITYQRGKRCCSDAFAKSLAEQLGLGHTCDTTGSFTDTASYTDLIAECTNVSVGYNGAHCAWEQTNVDYLFRLRAALLKADFTKLVEERKPGDSPTLYQSYSYEDGYYGQHSRRTDYWAKKDARYDEARKEGGKTDFELRALHKKLTGKDDLAWMDNHSFDNDVQLWFPKGHDRVGNSVADLVDDRKRRSSNSKVSYPETLRLIRTNDIIIADLLESLGYGGDEIKEYILDVGLNGGNVWFL